MKDKRIAAYLIPGLFIVLLLVIILVTGGFWQQKPAPGEQLRADFIDVGKGDCILIRSDTYTMMIDTGYEETGDRVLSRLKDEQVDAIDTLVITHYDKDHAGGVSSLLSNIDVAEIYSPAYESVKKTYESYVGAVSASQVTEHKIGAGECADFKKGGLDIMIEATDVSYDPSEKNDNDMSLMVRIDNKLDSWLFLGDIEKPGIKYFLDDSKISAFSGNLRYTLIKMPHHGRVEDNSDKLLEDLRRKSTGDALAIITDSEDERAESELIQELEENRFKYLTTADTGDIRVSGDGTLKISSD